MSDFVGFCTQLELKSLFQLFLLIAELNEIFWTKPRNLLTYNWTRLSIYTEQVKMKFRLIFAGWSRTLKKEPSMLPNDSGVACR